MIGKNPGDIIDLEEARKKRAFKKLNSKEMQDKIVIGRLEYARDKLRDLGVDDEIVDALDQAVASWAEDNRQGAYNAVEDVLWDAIGFIHDETKDSTVADEDKDFLMALAKLADVLSVMVSPREKENPQDIRASYLQGWVNGFIYGMVTNADEEED